MYLANQAASSNARPDARSASSSKSKPAVDSPLTKALRDGMGVQESQFVFALSARYGVVEREQARLGKGAAGVVGGDGYPGEGMIQSVRAMLPVGSGGKAGRGGADNEEENEEGGGGGGSGGSGGRKARFRAKGDVVLVKVMCLDQALWKVGGPAVALRLIHAANVSVVMFLGLGGEAHRSVRLLMSCQERWAFCLMG